MRFISGLMLAVLAGTATAQNKALPTAKPADPIARAVAAWKNVSSLSGTFEQQLTNPLVRSTTTAKGTFAQQRPNKLAVRFTEPPGDAIVADGKSLWVFLQQAAPGQVIKRPITDEMASPIDVGQFLDAPAARFDISARGAELVGDRPAQAVNLTPKKGTDAPFTRATVWIDDADGMVRQFEVTEQSGLVRRIRLTKLVVNPALAPSEFKFTVPRGVRIVER